MSARRRPTKQPGVRQRRRLGLATENGSATTRSNISRPRSTTRGHTVVVDARRHRRACRRAGRAEPRGLGVMRVAATVHLADATARRPRRRGRAQRRARRRALPLQLPLGRRLSRLAHLLLQRAVPLRLGRQGRQERRRSSTWARTAPTCLVRRTARGLASPLVDALAPSGPGSPRRPTRSTTSTRDLPRAWDHIVVLVEDAARTANRTASSARKTGHGLRQRRGAQGAPLGDQGQVRISVLRPRHLPPFPPDASSTARSKRSTCDTALPPTAPRDRDAEATMRALTDGSRECAAPPPAAATRTTARQRLSGACGRRALELGRRPRRRRRAARPSGRTRSLGERHRAAPSPVARRRRRRLASTLGLVSATDAAEAPTIDGPTPAQALPPPPPPPPPPPTPSRPSSAPGLTTVGHCN